MIIDIFARKNDRFSDLIIKNADELLIQLNKAKDDFNNATDFYHIESSIYKLNALEKEYSNAIKNAKSDKIENKGGRINWKRI